MKKLITIAALIFTTFSLFAQKKEISHSKWTEKSNGESYEMEVVSTNFRSKELAKPQLKFSVVGDKSKLTKVAITKSNDLNITIHITDESQPINLAPGLYTFVFSHQILGEKVFELDLKKGDDKVVVLTIK